MIRQLTLWFTIGLVCMPLLAFGFTSVELEKIAFTYRPEVEPAFFLKKADVQNQHNGIIRTPEMLALYKSIYTSIESDEVDFDVWAPGSGVSPKAFRIRVHVKNYGDEVSPPIPVQMVVSAKVGEYFVDQSVYMVDRVHLNNTAKWVQVNSLQGTIPPLASGESYDYFSEPIWFGEFLYQLTHQFPIDLQAAVSLPKSDTHQVLSLPIKADHFALEDLKR